jgi:lipid II:glycine glycyltransferase (peptidoglycan interpeptide bridge formation enzyme)
MVHMQIIELNKEQFDQFAYKHKNHNFYQTSQYGTLMNRHGYVDIYVGLLDDAHNIVGASLILTQKKFGNFKTGYAPRGFLIDFNDFNLVATFSRLLKQYLFHLGYIYVKIDPYVIHIERDNKGNPVPNGINNDELIDFLKTLNYEHKGFNLYFEALKPRWNAVTKLNASSDKLFFLFSKPIRNKIRKSFKRGITVYKGTRDDLKLFYNLIGKKHSRKLNYYMDFYEIFAKNDMFDLYFAKLDPAVYIKTSKDLYEYELKRNNELTNLVQQNTQSKSKNNYVNLKMNSDKLLSIYKNDIVNANNLFSAYPHGVVIATSAVIKYSREVFFLIDGYNPKFKSFCANHLMKWAIINEYSKKGYLYAHHNGITGDFNPSNQYYGLYEFKKGFNSDIVEYIGEFDLVINRQVYYTYQQVKLFKNLFDFKK